MPSFLAALYIQVGAATETEMKERSCIEDAGRDKTPEGHCGRWRHVYINAQPKVQAR